MANDEWKQAIKDIKYSETYYNDTPPYEYRQVMLPKVILENFPLIRMLKEHEWRAMGVEQSPTWVHYANRDGAVMLFRRPCRDNESDSENENEDKWKKAIPRIHYSNKYYDDKYEYRDVILPPIIAKKFPLVRLLAENEWRAMGVQQSCGWLHYAIYPPEPRILLFRRPLQQNNVEEVSQLQET